MSKEVVTHIQGYQEFPKWKYRGSAGVLVHTEADEQALGSGYTDAPSGDPAAPAIDPRDAEIAALKAQLAEAQASKSIRKG